MTLDFKISVILPVFNGEASLAQAINSACLQDVVDMEVILLDDGSSDDSFNIMKAYSNSRIRCVSHGNKGLAGTLNRGISLARGRYIARQDQDDLALPGRFARQLAFLEANPGIAMVGTWSQIYSGDVPAQRFHRHPSSNEALQLELLFDNPFVHSSMMIRVDVLQEMGGYSEDKSRQPPEDYELWSRIAREHRVANIPEVLTVYREVEGSMSRTGDNPFLANVIQISSENLAALLSPEFSMDECAALASLYHGRLSDDKSKAFTRTRALNMHKRAAGLLGGDVAQWSEEFSISFKRQHAHINSQFIRRRLPRALIGPARKIKRFLGARMNVLLKGG